MAFTLDRYRHLYKKTADDTLTASTSCSAPRENGPTRLPDRPSGACLAALERAEAG